MSMSSVSARAAATAVAAANNVETVVIGAGVVGLAIARALSSIGHEVIIIDRAKQIGNETSSRNSQVIHAGLYYKTNSYKAQFCVRGKELLYDYCQNNNIPYQQIGKLIIATTEPGQWDSVQKLHQQATDNGVPTQILSKEETFEKEPVLSNCDDTIQGALYSPTTGILDVHTLMVQLLADAESNDATLALQTTVENASIGNNTLQLYAGDMWFTCKNIINSSGLWADKIATMFHNNNNNNITTDEKSITTKCWIPPKQYYAKGNYFVSQVKTPNFTHLIYPVPRNDGGLGVHATIDVLQPDRIKFGPDIEWLESDIENPDTIDLKPNPNRSKEFYQSIRNTYWPNLPDNALIPDYSGIRPKLQHPKLPLSNNNDDFVIAGPETHHMQGLYHLFGIESPGLTSSMAIAEYITKVVQRDNNQNRI